MAKSRMKALQKLKTFDPIVNDPTVKFMFPDPGVFVVFVCLCACVFCGLMFGLPTSNRLVICASVCMYVCLFACMYV
jgi:hypothetical protein